MNIFERVDNSTWISKPTMSRVEAISFLVRPVVMRPSFYGSRQDFHQCEAVRIAVPGACRCPTDLFRPDARASGAIGGHACIVGSSAGDYRPNGSSASRPGIPRHRRPGVRHLAGPAPTQAALQPDRPSRSRWCSPSGVAPWRPKAGFDLVLIDTPTAPCWTVPMAAMPGEFDLLAALPAIADLERAARVQVVADGMATGTPLVVQPMIGRTPVRTTRDFRPGTDTRYTRVLGFGDTSARSPTMRRRRGGSWRR